MWADTLIVLTADNGGNCDLSGTKNTLEHSSPSNNFPLKGRKCTPWEGGTRTAAFVSGGVVPAQLRGTSSSVLIHIADWYATLSVLAGVDPTDSVLVPGGGKNDTPHDIDGVDVWPAITGTNHTHPRANASAPGQPAYFPTTIWSILAQYPNGTIMKLLTGAQQSNFFFPNGTQVYDDSPCVGSGPAVDEAGSSPAPLMFDGVEMSPPGGMVADPPSPLHCPSTGKFCCLCTPTSPCLYDVTKDPSELDNLAAAFPALVEEMAAVLGSYHVYIHGMRKDALAKYNCTTQDVLWGNFSGPCCTPLGAA